MSTKAPPTIRLLNGWPTRRFELLSTRVCDLDVGLSGSLYEKVIDRVRRDLRRRGLVFFPEVYLSTGWHCPDRVSIVGVPFTLATAELRRLERDVTGELESYRDMVGLVRHEVGHAYNYAFRLHETKEWREAFGAFSRPYRERYEFRAQSRNYVRHLRHHYAQKHPDEDFAETFAVWLNPRRSWREQHEGWGALRKLEYVDRVMAELRGASRIAPHGPRLDPVGEVTMTVARHYQHLGYRLEEYGFEDEAVAFVDEDLKAVFAGRRTGGAAPASSLLRRLRRRIVDNVVQLLSVHPSQANHLYDKYVARAEELGIETGREAERRLLVGVTTMMTTHLVNKKHTGRFTRKHPLRVRCR